MIILNVNNDVCAVVNVKYLTSFIYSVEFGDARVQNSPGKLPFAPAWKLKNNTTVMLRVYLIKEHSPSLHFEIINFIGNYYQKA